MIFKKFFSSPHRPADGSGEQPPQRPDPARQPQQRGQHQTAEGEKVQPAPQSRRGHMVDAHLSVVPQEGEGEQGRGGPQPEQQIQQEGQPGQLQAPAQGARPIVDKAQRRPQQEAQAKDHRLVRDVYVHGQRSRRAKNPPRSRPSSS